MVYKGITRQAYNGHLQSQCQKIPKGFQMAVCALKSQEIQSKFKGWSHCRVHTENLKGRFGRSVSVSRGDREEWFSSKEATEWPMPFPFPFYSNQATSLLVGATQIQGRSSLFSESVIHTHSEHQSVGCLLCMLIPQFIISVQKKTKVKKGGNGKIHSE